MPDDNWAMVGGAQQSGQSNVNYGFSLCMQSYTTTYGILIYRPSASSDTKEDNSKFMLLSLDNYEQNYLHKFRRYSFNNATYSDRN